MTEVCLTREPNVERIELGDGAWVDVCRGFLEGASELYDSLVTTRRWSQAKLFRYERAIEEPRLTSWVRTDDPDAPRPLLDAHRSLQHRYRARFDGFALAWYRDGHDSVAFHRDTDLKWLDDTVIAILTLGATRPFQLRPREHRHRHDLDGHGATHDLAPASGDLLVMGGTTQQHWEHAVPKAGDLQAGRVSVQWRWTSRQGRQFPGSGYRAPLRFSR